ncbi:MAG: NUDIX domain-containing protein, partial [Oscillospiraceae bacterium]|nr:NUDIX domain-containing protein [Oscillospiraceae bacterium]
MGYIMDLRKHVGHEALIGVGATVLVFNIKNELLLNLRSDTNNWGIPGGSKELHETLEECAVMELKEETNINAGELELVTVLSGKNCYFKYPNGDELDCVIALYKVKNYDGELKINDGESTELKFFPLNDLPD